MKNHFFKNLILSLLVAQTFWFLPKANATPAGLTFQGRLVKNDVAVESNPVTLTIKIKSVTDACLLYEETHNLNMTGSDGIFSLKIGGGTRTVNDKGLSLIQVFSNSGSAITALTCTGAVTSYTSASTDTRNVFVSFDDGIDTVAFAAPYVIQSVPYAIEAEKLAGKSASEYLQVTSITTQSKLNDLMVPDTYSEILALINGTTSQYTKANGSGFLPTGAISFNSQRITSVATPASGTDAANKNYCDATIGSKAADTTTLAALAAGDSGKVLSWSGTQWTAATISTADATKLPLSGGTMSGPVAMGGNNITGSGYITQNSGKYLQLGSFTDATEAALIATPLTAGQAGSTWYNTTSNQLKFWNGATAQPVGPWRDDGTGKVSYTGGNVGIGTGAPNSLLHVTGALGGGSNVQSSFENTDPTGYTTLYLGNTATGTKGLYLEYFGDTYPGTPEDAFEAGYGSLISASQTSGLNLGTAGASAPLKFFTGGWTANKERMRVDSAGKVGIGVKNPTAVLHLKAGADVANSGAPLKFTSGTNLTTPENGAVEYNGTDLFLTSGGIRRTLTSSIGGSANLSGITNASGSIVMSPMVGNSVIVDQTTVSTSPTSGALIVNGGAGIAGALNIGGPFSQTFTGTGNASALIANSVTTASAQSIIANGLTSGSIMSLTSNSTTAAAGNTGLNVALSGANGTAGITRTGISSAVTSTGATSTNVGGFFSASGATNNYGLIVGSGNVGIGTTSPSSKLHVAGTGQVLDIGDGSNTATYAIFSNAVVPRATVGYDGNGAVLKGGTGKYVGLTSNNNANAALVLSSTNNSVGLGGAITDTATLAGSTLVATSTGNVGIGTTTPESIANTSALTINNTGIGGGATAYQVGGVRTGLVNGNDNYFTIQSYASRPLSLGYNGNNTIVVNTANNVGIGTTNPAEKLEVTGNINVTGQVKSPSSTYYFDATNGLANFTNAYFGNWYGSDSVLRLVAGVGKTYFPASAGNIGIGTSAPSVLLEVNGSSVRATRVAVPSQYLETSGTLDGDGSAVMLKGVGGNKRMHIQILDNGATATSNDIVFSNGTTTAPVERMRILANGNVGIGTESPNTTIDLNGALSQRGIAAPAVSVSGQGRIYFDSTSNKFRVSQNNSAYTDLVNPATGDLINGGNTTGATVVVGTNDAQSLALETGGTTKMTILSGGNVGIGTTAPGFLLDVNGIAKASDLRTLLLKEPGGTRTVFESDNAGKLYFGSTTAGAAKMTDIVFNNSGNVGIGTTSPSQALHTVGKGYFQGTNGIYIDPNIGGANMAVVATDVSQSLQLRSGSSPLMTLQATGNVGIGTTSPSERLEVSGNVKATAFISTSDQRLKTNIVRIPASLEIINQLNGYSYNWLSNGQKDYGVIAQEVEKVMPESVATDSKTGLKSVKYNNLIAPIIESLKELYRMITSQDEKIARLETQNRELEARLKKLEQALQKKHDKK